jgi:tight adherence protein C
VVFFLPLMAFLFVTLLVAAAAMKFSAAGTSDVERRLAELSAPGAKTVSDTPLFGQIVAGLKKLGEAAPRSKKEAGKIQSRLVTAGYRRREAIAIFFGIRVGMGVVMFVLFSLPVVMKPNVGFALCAAGLGYLLPGIVLARVAKRRQHRIRLGLPDALDLLVVSVEAGLGLDQAIQRVSDELAFAHPELCDELRLINLELRAGKARAEALHNLAERTQLDDLTSLVAMLVQTDKFGTSVAQSLRVHSDTLRTKRRQRAEEAAAKTGAKMVFPLVFCIFPSIWVVTLGPAVIKFIKVFIPMTQK